MRQRRPRALTVKEHIDPKERVALRVAKRSGAVATRTPRKNVSRSKYVPGGKNKNLKPHNV